MMFYTDKEEEDSTYSLPDAETFYMGKSDFHPDTSDTGSWMEEYGKRAMEEDNTVEYLVGWYFWYCQPGCLPDSEPYGPFKSEEAAMQEAHDWN